jgi:hypothetical protein
VASDPEVSCDDQHPDPDTRQLWWEPPGRVYTVYPADDVVEKMVSIAKALGAHVLDDDGNLHA